MPPSETTRLSAAGPADHVLLSNLLELYIHDLSEAFPHVQLGADGRFGYPSLPLYWSERDRHFAFLISHGASIAGFALVTRGSPAVASPDVYDLAEFFVLRRHRRAGVGRSAAFLLWRSLPGAWVVRVSEANPAALAFWGRVIGEFANDGATRSTRPGRTQPWQVFEFDSTPSPERPLV
ncbi:MAG TPA: GNAT family N-acetyltransferase [Polyangiaceae bacterium]|nr:GNAT family N-acetyltransferase [Polyangiaceae bacterium]